MDNTHKPRPSRTPMWSDMVGSDSNRSRSRSRSSHRTTQNHVNIQHPTNSTNHSSSNNLYTSLNDNVVGPEVNINNTRNNPPQKVSKPPPITVFDIDINNLNKKLSEISTLNRFKTQIKLTQYGTKIYVQDDKQHETVKKYFIDKGIQFFTHTLRDERNIKVCLYGLWRMEVNDLKVELNALGIQPKEIKRLEIRNKRYDDQCIYLLYFSKKDKVKISDLRKTTAIFSLIVRWEYYTPKIKGPTQCSNCLAYGHGSENCFKKSNCIRCGDAHESSKCPHILSAVDSFGTTSSDSSPKIPIAKVRCANCKQNHTANFKGCKSRKEYEEIQNRVRSRNSRVNPRVIQPNIQDRQQFPPLQSSRSSWFNSASQSRQQFSNNNSPNDLFSPQQCQEIMNEFIQKLSNCRNKIQQIQVIGEITFKYVYDYGQP